MKPGIKTTEFWITLLAVVVGSLLATGVIAPDSNAAKIAGAILAGLGAVGYPVSRGMTKAAASKSESGRAFLPVTGLAVLLVLAAGCATGLGSGPFGSAPEEAFTQDVDFEFARQREEVKQDVRAAVREAAAEEGVEIPDAAVEALAREVYARVGGIVQNNILIFTLDPNVAAAIIQRSMEGLSEVVGSPGEWIHGSTKETNDDEPAPPEELTPEEAEELRKAILESEGGGGS